MKSTSVLKNVYVEEYKSNVLHFVAAAKSLSRYVFNPSVLALIAEVGINFFRYMKSLGISKEPNLIVLSSRDHYSYNKHELKNVRILINLKKLNLIKHLDIFLNALVRVLPPDTTFVGYFSDRKAVKPGGYKTDSIFNLLRKLFKIFGNRSSHLLNRNEVMEILEKNGFKTINMKEMNGLTYFISRSFGLPA